MTTMAIESRTGRFAETLSSITTRIGRATGIVSFWYTARLVFLLSEIKAESELALAETEGVLIGCGGCPQAQACIELHTRRAESVVNYLDKIGDLLKRARYLNSMAGAFYGLAARWENVLEELYLRASPDLYDEYCKAVEGMNNPEDLADIRSVFAAESELRRSGRTVPSDSNAH